ncbi:protein kinase [Thiotrichales bacterium 19S3-7]|nr:protein kinase [Thiotrichales bacterium 19S3-7]MCF6802034.1 protein kinase [Thiotrichales bacterium 19S3-11]
MHPDQKSERAYTTFFKLSNGSIIGVINNPSDEKRKTEYDNDKAVRVRRITNFSDNSPGIIKTYDLTVPNVKEKIAHEIKIHRKLADHKNTKSLIYDVITRENKIHLIMEDGGESLSTRLKQGELPIAEAFMRSINFLIELNTLHSIGYAHLDLQPENILLINGVVKLIDFELSRKISKKGIVGGNMVYLPIDFLDMPCKQIDLFEAIRVIAFAKHYYQLTQCKDIVTGEIHLQTLFLKNDRCANHSSIFSHHQVNDSPYLSAFANLAMKDLTLPDNYDAINLAIFLILIEKNLCHYAETINLSNNEFVKSKIISQYLKEPDKIDASFLDQLKEQSVSNSCDTSNGSIIYPIIQSLATLDNNANADTQNESTSNSNYIDNSFTETSNYIDNTFTQSSSNPESREATVPPIWSDIAPNDIVPRHNIVTPDNTRLDESLEGCNI